MHDIAEQSMVVNDLRFAYLESGRSAADRSDWHAAYDAYRPHLRVLEAGDLERFAEGAGGQVASTSASRRGRARSVATSKRRLRDGQDSWRSTLHVTMERRVRALRRRDGSLKPSVCWATMRTVSSTDSCSEATPTRRCPRAISIRRSSWDRG